MSEQQSTEAVTPLPVLEYHIKPYGPVVTHDFPCPVYGCPNEAVLDLSAEPASLFGPCRKHEAEGYVLVKATGWRRHIMRWISLLTWLM